MPKSNLSRELKALGASEPSPKRDPPAGDLQALSEAAGGEANVSRMQPLLNELSKTPALPIPDAQSLLQERWQDANRDLYEACVSGDLVSVKSIFKEWRNHPLFPDPIERSLQYLLVVAADAGYGPTVSFLLDQGAVMTDSITSSAAAMGGEGAISVFGAFYEHGFRTDNYCEGDILTAAIHNRALMELLLSNGADPNAVDVYNFRPLDCANNVAELELLISHGAKPMKSNALHHAIQTEEDDECYKMMEFLLEKEVNVNALALLDKKGRKKGGTALHWAISGFNAPSRMKRATKLLPRMKWLLVNGANPGLLDEQKKKAVEYADDQKMIDLLNNWVSPMVEGEVIVKTDDHGSRSNENLDNTVSGSGGSRKRKAGSLEGKRKKKA